MNAKRRVATVAVAVAVALAMSACSGGGSDDAAPTTTVPAQSPLRGRPLPAAVEVREQTGNDPIADPKFTAMPGARAEYGRLGGSSYQIEIPEKWNGRLLLFMHGFAEYSGILRTGPPDFRNWLITHGYAWGASSFSSTSLIPGLAADETAALWDHFVAEHGRPTWTYAAGFSMGGWATAIVAERYGNRFDGALGMCGAVGSVPGIEIDSDFFVAAAFAAGVTQGEYDAANDIGKLIDDRIKPALAEPATLRRFEDIVIGLTGGPRAFDREGLEAEMATKWRRARLLVGAHIAPQPDAYRLAPGSGVTTAEFNRGAIRLRIDRDAFDTFAAGTEVTGKLAMPLLTLHTTGDEQVPINQAQILRRRVEAAGKSALLAQRVFADPGHCGFSTPEQEMAMQALVQWVEHGRRPAATDLGITDLRKVHPTFELAPRRTDTTTGAHGNVVFHGNARLDGKPFDAQFVGAVVLDDNLVTPCNMTIPTIIGGRFTLGVYGAQNSAGCGRAGARVVMWTYSGSRNLFATSAVEWPARGGTADVSVEFSSPDPEGAAPAVFGLSGEVHAADGASVGPGALVEAFIGATRCGVASIRSGSFVGYILNVVGPESIPGCKAGATITFTVDGAPVVETIANGGEPPHGFDLTVR